MSLTGGKKGRRNFNISMQLGLWSEQTGLGVAFDSSTCLNYPIGRFARYCLGRTLLRLTLR